MTAGYNTGSSRRSYIFNGVQIPTVVIAVVVRRQWGIVVAGRITKHAAVAGAVLAIVRAVVMACVTANASRSIFHQLLDIISSGR